MPTIGMWEDDRWNSSQSQRHRDRCHTSSVLLTTSYSLSCQRDRHCCCYCTSRCRPWRSRSSFFVLLWSYCMLVLLFQYVQCWASFLVLENYTSYCSSKRACVFFYCSRLHTSHRKPGMVYDCTGTKLRITAPLFWFSLLVWPCCRVTTWRCLSGIIWLQGKYSSPSRGVCLFERPLKHWSLLVGGEKPSAWETQHEYAHVGEDATVRPTALISKSVSWHNRLRWLRHAKRHQKILHIIYFMFQVSALLQRSLSKRLAMQELRNKGIYIVDTDASYALLVHQVRGYKWVDGNDCWCAKYSQFVRHMYCRHIVLLQVLVILEKLTLGRVCSSLLSCGCTCMSLPCGRESEEFADRANAECDFFWSGLRWWLS